MQDPPSHWLSRLRGLLFAGSNRGARLFIRRLLGQRRCVQQLERIVKARHFDQQHQLRPQRVRVIGCQP